MSEIAMSPDAGFPVAWWLWWFVAATFAYALIAVWFWRAAQRHDETVAEDQGPGAAEPH